MADELDRTPEGPAVYPGFGRARGYNAAPGLRRRIPADAHVCRQLPERGRSREPRDAVRAAIFQLPGKSDAKGRTIALASIQRRLAHVTHHNPGTARRLRRQLETQIRER